MVKIKKILNIILSNEILIFVDSNLHKEKDLSLLVSKNYLKHKIIYKKTPYYNKKLKAYNSYSKLFLFPWIFSFLIILCRSKNKIVIFSQPYEAIKYIFFLKKLIVYFYDTQFGLLYEKKVKIFLEKIVIKNVSKVIIRDFRIYKFYKKIIKKKNVKKILIPDFVNKKNKIVTSKNKNYFVILGWFDNDNVSAFRSIEAICKLGFSIKICISKFNYNFIEYEIKNLKTKYPNNLELYIDIYGEKLEKELESCKYSICPHDRKKPQLSEDYIKFASSSRIIDYIKNNLIIFLSPKAIYQNYVIKSHGGICDDIKLLQSFKSSDDLNIYFNYSFKIKKKLFNFDFLKDQIKKILIN